MSLGICGLAGEALPKVINGFLKNLTEISSANFGDLNDITGEANDCMGDASQNPLTCLAEVLAVFYEF